MTKRERIMSAVAGHEPDRVPVSFWYHFRLLDHPSAEPLAKEEIAFYKKYDVDFLKVMHDLILDMPEGLPVIEDPEDWRKIKPLDPRKGNFAEQLKALKIMRNELGGGVPIIDTVFNPFASAQKLCNKKLVEHFRANPEAVLQGLRAITISLADYSQAWIEEGGDGIYYALDGAQTTTMSEEEYRDAFLPLDNIVLSRAMETGVFNVLHVHGENIMFDLTQNLPNHVLVWSDKLTKPTLAEGRAKHQGCIAGGINEMTIDRKNASEVIAEAQEAIAEAGKGGFILTPGCAVPTETREELLIALRQSVEN